MAKLVLNISQIAVFQKLAKVSQMDNWFNLDDSGILRDRERNNRIMSVRNGCRQLIEGLTPEDLENLDGGEVYTLLWFIQNHLK